MRARNARAILTAGFLIGCAAPTPAPPSWSPTPEQAQKRVLGHWVIVEVDTGTKYSGELIAIGQVNRPDTTIYVGTEEDILAIPSQRARRIKVVEHGRSGSGAILWTWAGAISTVSHGFFLALTAPIWLLFGSIPAAINAPVGVETHRAREVAAANIRKYARFPQGLPLGLRATIREVPSR